jgi:hypothetical protein
MNKFLKILGAVFLSLIVIVVIAAVILIPKSLWLNDDAVAYLEKNIPAIVEHWDAAELEKRSASEILTDESKVGLPRMFKWLETLGNLKGLETPLGQIGTGTLPGTPFNGTWGTYTIKAEFESGPAEIKVVLKRVGESWEILGFTVNSPALLPTES